MILVLIKLNWNYQSREICTAKKYRQMPYLYISTAFSVVQEVLPALEYIAAKNKLALYDVERDKTYYKNLVDDAFITQKLREKTL